MQAVSSSETTVEKATFAGGCFWCMEHPFEELDGIQDVVSGYTGGQKENPTYEEVSSGTTGHREAVQVVFAPAVVSYSRLLDIFWKQIDPTDPEGQFVDRGYQYSTAIYYHSEDQKKQAELSRDNMQKSGRYEKPIVTEILPVSEFYVAEEYHQDYAKKNKVRYKLYRFYSGRDQYLKKIWKEEEKSLRESIHLKEYGRPSEEDVKKKLSPLQYRVTQEDGTEPAFNNAYWNNKKEGIYVDIVSGEPLFSSTDKFSSGTGWPSFTKPLFPHSIVEKEDNSLFMTRTEVRSKHGDSHLGHVFNDGPEPTGLRYCINSAALRFILKKDLEKEGYGEYLKLFEK